MHDEAIQVATLEARFTISWEHERPSTPVPLSRLLEQNQDYPSLCQWLGAAKVGEESRWGGGAAPLCVIKRVS